MVEDKKCLAEPWEALLDDWDFLGPDFVWETKEEPVKMKPLKNTSEIHCDLQKYEGD